MIYESRAVGPLQEDVRQMRVAMIAAGGEGTRFGAEIPKQYVKVLGKPVIVYSMENFEKSPEIDAIQVVCKPQYMQLVRDMAEEYGISKLRWVSEGGREFQDSIRNGVYALREHLADDDIVMMHPGVMPMLAQSAIADGIHLCVEKGCSFTMFPTRFCMARRTGDGWTDECVYKEDFIELNAPWTFRYGSVYDLYREAEKLHKGESVRDYTLNLWIDMGHKAYYFRGDDSSSMKITTPFDLELFEAYLLVQRKKERENA